MSTARGTGCAGQVPVGTSGELFTDLDLSGLAVVPILLEKDWRNGECLRVVRQLPATNADENYGPAPRGNKSEGRW